MNIKTTQINDTTWDVTLNHLGLSHPIQIGCITHVKWDSYWFHFDSGNLAPMHSESMAGILSKIQRQIDGEPLP